MFLKFRKGICVISLLTRSGLAPDPRVRPVLPKQQAGFQGISRKQAGRFCSSPSVSMSVAGPEDNSPGMLERERGKKKKKARKHVFYLIW